LLNTNSGVQADAPSGAPVISRDGSAAVFQSFAENLAMGDRNTYQDVFFVRLDTGAVERVSTPFGEGTAPEASVAPTISSDGSVVAFASRVGALVADDSNREWDVFVATRY
jgi:Tol biopolymer transport system component